MRLLWQERVRVAGFVRLRAWREEDKPPFRALNADPRVMAFFPSTLSASQSDALIELDLRQTDLTPQWRSLRILYEDDSYWTDSEGVMLCRVCGPLNASDEDAPESGVPS